jgi:BlaI family transcriptional regulator, penicillinase repressor
MTDRPLPTDAELLILTVLWKRGPSTVRDVHESLRASQDTGYTTVLKLLQIMTQKGLVKRDESQRSHVYRAAVTEDRTQRRLVGELLDKAFAGSAGDLVMRALSVKTASPAEIAAIRAMLDEAERKEAK